VFAVSTDRPSRSEPERQLLDDEVELADEIVRARNSADDRDLPRITARHDPTGGAPTDLLDRDPDHGLAGCARTSNGGQGFDLSCATKSPS
jgi:hypothetical protein